jgi:hypothetical protein
MKKDEVVIRIKRNRANKSIDVSFTIGDHIKNGSDEDVMNVAMMFKGIHEELKNKIIINAVTENSDKESASDNTQNITEENIS